MLKRIKKNEKGQGLVEYGLILALVSIVAIGVLGALGGKIEGTFRNVNKSLDTSVVAPPLEDTAPPLDDASYTWIADATYGYTSTNPAHTGNGYYKYTGSASEVLIPHTIHGHSMTNYHNMFRASPVVKVINTNPNITSMSQMFRESTAVLDLSELNTENVTNMDRMFTSLQAVSIDVSMLNTSKVTSMIGMFASPFVKEITFGGFDTSNVVNMSTMFTGLTATTLDLSGFNTSNVETMNGTFSMITTPTLDLSGFDLSKLANYNNIFYGAETTSVQVKDEPTRVKLNDSNNRPVTMIISVK